MTAENHQMRVIRAGERGPAVEDVQRRLLLLNYDLGLTGVDGVFLEGTAAAIRRFQEDSGLYVDGVVGPRTWSALVDSTFSFGDRMLYLRSPFFHGNDVAVLQGALNGLGFNCGPVDAIFGPYTERAVIEFQENAGVVGDGVVGVNTLAALSGLRHIWGPRGSATHSQAVATPTGRGDLLEHLQITIIYAGQLTHELASRIANVATASTDRALVTVAAREGALDAETAFVPGRRPVTIELVEDDEDASRGGGIVVRYAQGRDALALALAGEVRRIGADLGRVGPAVHVVVRIGTEPFHKGSKQGIQNVATTVLDAVCTTFG